MIKDSGKIYRRRSFVREKELITAEGKEMTIELTLLTLNAVQRSGEVISFDDD